MTYCRMHRAICLSGRDITVQFWHVHEESNVSDGSADVDSTPEYVHGKCRKGHIIHEDLHVHQSLIEIRPKHAE